MSIINQGWFGILAGLFGGGLISLYFYFKGQGRVSLATRVTHALIIEPEQPDDRLEVRYDSRIVPRVTRTVVGLWNDGNQTIRRSHLSERDHLRIHLSEGDILRVNMLNRTREATWPQITGVSSRQAILDFDFLNPNDGFSVEVVHSGHPEAVKVAGVIEGMSIDVGETKPPSKMLSIIYWIIVAAGIVIIAAMTLALLSLLLWVAYKRPFPWNIIIAACTVLLAFAVWPGRSTRRKTDAFRISSAPKVVSDSLVANIPWLRDQN